MPVQDDQISGMPYRQCAHQNRIHGAENSRIRPMPNASDSTAIVANRRFLHKVRHPYRRSWASRSSDVQPHISRIPSLLDKLRKRLAVPIHTDEEALFVLVGARKLIELGAYKKNELLAGRFMTDWAVHSVIDRNSWSRDSLLFMDSIFAQKRPGRI
jgi:hypothetical protein